MQQQLTYNGQTEGGSLSDTTLAEIIGSATIPLGAGYGPLTALANGGQAGATQLQLGLNRLGTVATNGDSVLLPPATPGAIVVVVNAGAASANVFPSGATDIINALAVQTALAVAAAAVTIFFCTLAGKWNSK
jgi:hypothetical protein